jgi:hypothetical protein
VTGRAAGGAAAGAAAGAELGSVVPGIGTALGAGGGAVVGGIGGAAAGARARKEWRAAMRADSAGPRKLLVVEFLVCMVITALSPLTGKTTAPTLMRRMAAVLALFFLLGLVSAGGRTAAKVSASLGGLVAVVLLVSDRDVFTHLANVFANRSAAPASTSTGPPATVDV